MEYLTAGDERVRSCIATWFNLWKLNDVQRSLPMKDFPGWYLSTCLRCLSNVWEIGLGASEKLEPCRTWWKPIKWNMIRVRTCTEICYVCSALTLRSRSYRTLSQCHVRDDNKNVRDVLRTQCSAHQRWNYSRVFALRIRCLALPPAAWRMLQLATHCSVMYFV